MKCERTGKKKASPYLWPSNGQHPMSVEGFGRWLKTLAHKAGIKTGSQKLTFHCFRKLLMQAGIEQGVGLAAVKLIVGKAVASSDQTYIVQTNLEDHFVKIARYLNVTQVESAKSGLENTIVNQQKELESLHGEVTDLKQRLDVLTREMKRMQVRYTHRGGHPPYKHLSDQECDEIIAGKEKSFRELRKNGLTIQ